MKKPFVFLLALLGFAVASGAAAFEVDPELEQFERSLETRLQERIKTVFGSEQQLSVTVHAKTESPATAPKKPGSRIDVENGAYAPFPVDLASEFDGEESKAGEPNLRITQLDIVLQVPDDLDAKVIEDAQTLLKNSVKDSYSPRISVTKLSSLNRKLASAPPAAPGAEQPKESPWYRAFLAQFGLLGAALILSAALLMIGFTIRSSVHSIADGLRLHAATNSNVTLSSKGMELGGSMELKGDGGVRAPKGAGAAPNPEVSLQAYGTNIRLFQQTLKDDPMLIAQTLQDSEAEWTGVRSLLPCLTAEDHENLKKCLGPTRVAHLAETVASHEDPPGWLREFTERLMLRKVQGGKKVARILGPERTTTLALAAPSTLVAAAKELSTRGAWRVATDFLPHDEVNGLLGGLSENEWRLLASAAAATPEEITEAAGQMLARVAQAPDEDPEARDRKDYLRNILLEPAVKLISSKEPGEDEQFLESLSSEMPELAELVRGRVWTVSQLALVPDGALVDALRELTHDEKALLLYALPDRESKRLEAILPAGNVRTIVLDRLRAVRERAAAPERRLAVEVTRRYVDYLRRQAEAKRFELVEPLGLRDAA